MFQLSLYLHAKYVLLRKYGFLNQKHKVNYVKSPSTKHEPIFLPHLFIDRFESLWCHKF